MLYTLHPNAFDVSIDYEAERERIYVKLGGKNSYSVNLLNRHLKYMNNFLKAILILEVKVDL